MTLKVTRFLAEEFSAVRLQQKEILDLLEQVKSLRLQNEEINRHLAYLESRVNDLELYTRINNVIVTQLKIKPRLYACAVTANKVGRPEKWMLT